jgi:ATP-dependent protease ClpP protease subunit
MRTGSLNRTPFDLSNVDKFLNSIKSESFIVYTRNAKGDEPAELCIYDAVGKDWDGSGIDAKDVSAFLAENRGKAVNIKINSPGGLVYDGLTIYNSLISHDGPVTATIEGIAASIASIIAMAADKVRMSAVASMMVHRAIGVCIGNESDMEDCRAWLATIDKQLSNVYAGKTGRKASTMLDYMKGNVDGTLFDAQAALDAKLIDEIIPVRGDKKKNAKNEVETKIEDVPDETEVRNELDKSLAAETHRKIMKQKASARLRVLEVSGE